MVRTVILSSCVTVQGIFVRMLDDGRMVVRVGDRTYAGRPVSEVPRAA